MALGSSTDKGVVNGKATDAAGDYQRQRNEDGRACSLAAHEYLRYGWSVLALCTPDHACMGKTHSRRCEHPGKAPWGEWKEFQDRLPTECEIREKWQANCQLNVGMCLGPVSGLVGIDVDGPGGADELAKRSAGDLPKTLEFVTGSGGRRLLYKIPRGAVLKTTAQKKGEKEELRLQARGSQTVMPPSRHHSGGVYAWKPGHSPKDIEAAMAPDWLVRELTPTQAEKPSSRTANNGPPLLEDEALLAKAMDAKNGEKFRRYWEGGKGDDPSAADQGLCNLLAFWTGCNAEQMDRLFRRSGLMRGKWDEIHYANGWTHGQGTIATAIEGCRETYNPGRSGGRQEGPAGQEGAGAEVPIRPNEAPDDPHRLARGFLRGHACDEVPPEKIWLRYWAEEWYGWDGHAYRKVPAKEIRARVVEWVKHEFNSINVHQLAAGFKGKPPTVKKVTGDLVGNVMQALTGLTLLPSTLSPPAWISGRGPFPAAGVLVAKNQLVHLPTLMHSAGAYTCERTLDFFSFNSLDYDYLPEAPEPANWLAFLNQLWPDDPHSVAVLQDWFGYMLTPDTRQQKILMLIGPKRSGKGTIARVLRGPVGPDNVA
jgi:putative DNA primase/helicase